MIYRDSSIPDTYNYITKLSDNYIVWQRQKSYVSSFNNDAYIQYLNPPYVIYVNNFNDISNISKFDFYYNSSGELEEMTSLNSSSDNMYVSLDQFYSDKTSRPDYPQIFACSILIVICFVWILNQLTKFVKKDGVFH